MANITINQKHYKNVKEDQTFQQVLKDLALDHKFDSFLALKNNQFCSLNEKVCENCNLQFFDKFGTYPAKAYLNTAILILRFIQITEAPEFTIKIQHSVSDGVYGEFKDKSGTKKEKINKLKTCFKETVEKNLPILPEVVSRTDTIHYFEKNGRKDTADLLQFCSQDFINLYTLEGIKFWVPFPVAAETGLISIFEIMAYKDGFLLRTPSTGDHSSLKEFYDQGKLFNVFKEFIQWGEILDLNSIYDINQAIIQNKISDIIKISEAMHEKKIANIAERISREDKKLIFISGPSSSGKTTFSKRLSIQLRALGYESIPISLDDYFKDRDELRAEQGENMNFEVLEALDLELLNNHLQKMLKCEKVAIPAYDFSSGEKIMNNREIIPDQDTFIILEGIHGINPNLTPVISSEHKFKIYVSALTHLNFNDFNRISTHDMRLIRRVVRDARYRNYPADQTIRLWENVVEGEKKYIFKYQSNADVMFNSALVYETSVLKNEAMKFLKAIRPENDTFPIANRLVNILSYYLPVYQKEIPPTSIIREFIGGSSFNF
ncbi:MAG: nucleoside kinase [Candidatus Marinimicrobia bacterium]|nr:nucleoside kinase [Candidatus Neomarinimicrobiota bacterium]